MTLDLIRYRADTLPDIDEVPTIIGTEPIYDELELEERIVPNMKFNCSGNLTSAILGVTLRSLSTLEPSEHPIIQIWRQNNQNDNTYTLVDSQAITYTLENISNYGIYVYKFDPPLQFEDGDILGVFAGSSLHSITSINDVWNFDSQSYLFQTQKDDDEPPNLINFDIEEYSTGINRYLLISPTTGTV